MKGVFLLRPRIGLQPSEFSLGLQNPGWCYLPMASSTPFPTVLLHVCFFLALLILFLLLFLLFLFLFLLGFLFGHPFFGFHWGSSPLFP